MWELATPVHVAEFHICQAQPDAAYCWKSVFWSTWL